MNDFVQNVEDLTEDNVTIAGEQYPASQMPRTCSVCGEVKGYRSFAKIDKTSRRRTKCNSCNRAQLKAAEFGMTLEEMKSFSKGPCVMCGATGNVKAYVDPKSDYPLARVCATHRGYFRAFLRWDELTLFKEIAENFPVWLDLLKKHDLSLFEVD